MRIIYFSAERYCYRFSQQNFIYLFSFFLLFFTLGIHSLVAQTYPSGFSQVQVAGGISNPTVMAFAPDGRIFVAEQAGRLRVIKNGALLSTPFVQLNVNASGERGLIGIALDPNFANNNYIYLYYTVPSAPIHNRISRFTANGDVALAGSETIILELDNLSGATNHNGGAMRFGIDGKLYVAVGENANPNYAQNLDTYHGKLLRMNADGSVPSGNPYPSGSQQRQRVWSYGLRNPFTFDIQPGTGKIFVNDVGQNTWEEINDATASGLNFGWPLVEGTSTNPAFANPVYAYGQGRYSPNGSYLENQGCAITGGVFFNPVASSYPSAFIGKYFFFDYCNTWLNVLDFSGNTAVRSSFATNITPNWSWNLSLSVGNDGNLYYFTRNPGALYKIIYTNNNVPVITSQPTSATITQGQSASFGVSASGMQPLSYQWQKNGVNIAGATAATFSIANVQPSNAGRYRAIVTNAAGSATSNAAILTVSAFNSTPTASITSPANGTLYRAGTVISFSGIGSDPEDGTLPASAYTWTAIFHHDTHTHPGPAVTVAPDGKSGSFSIPAEGHLEANVWYRLQLTVRDSQGLSTTTYVDLRPQVVTLSFNSNPSGLTINVAGQPRTAPYSFQTVAGVVTSLSTPSSQTLNGTSYTFSNWQNGLGSSGTITVPNTNTTYTANFTANSTLRNSDTVINPENSLNFAYYEGSWNLLPNFSALTAIRTGKTNSFNLSTRNRDNFFGFEFNGYVNVPADGVYTFYTSSDDGSKLWIGSTLVVDNDGLHSLRERSGTIGLKAGYHAIRTAYFEHGGSNELEVKYAGPGLSKQLIPGTALFTNNATSQLAYEGLDVQANREATVLVYPNPAKDYITIRVYAENEREVTVNISDLLSRNLSSTRHAVKVGSNNLSQYVGNLPEGLHSVIIVNDSHRIIRKILIRK